jgi:hypothetical protein
MERVTERMFSVKVPTDSLHMIARKPNAMPLVPEQRLPPIQRPGPGPFSAVAK